MMILILSILDNVCNVIMGFKLDSLELYHSEYSLLRFVTQLIAITTKLLVMNN